MHESDIDYMSHDSRKWMILMKNMKQNGNVGGKDYNSVEDVNISALHWSEFTREFCSNSWIHPQYEPLDYFSVTVKADFLGTTGKQKSLVRGIHSQDRVK